MKKITLCADDYGQNESISQGILQLIKNNRLSAVSCMTNYEGWPIYGAQLATLKKEKDVNIDVGLHFDLTHFIQDNKWSFNQFIVQCCLHNVNLHTIEKTLTNQLDAFEKTFSCPPRFVDGHQHIHMFPGIRRIFIKVLTERYQNHLPYIRLSTPTFWGHDAHIKAIILRILAIGFAQQAKRSGLAFPTHFLGLYSLKAAHYATLFRGWLTQAPTGSLFMCHPGMASNDHHDPIKKARLVEFNYFNSDDFLTDLSKHQTVISKWHSI